MIEIDKKLIDKITDKAKNSSRLRMTYNFHTESEDSLHRMINSLCRGTYIRPHKHENPDKREAFIILTGKVLIVEFTEDGKISNHFILNNEMGSYGAEIAPGTYHTLIPLTSQVVVYEVKDGPYNITNDKRFAPWAPEEGSEDAPSYNDHLLKQLNIF